MSMLSAQCAELRDKAKLLRGHADGLTAPYVIPSTKELMMLTMLDSATRMEEAADTIISLRDRLQDATLGRGTCKPTEEDYCPICGEDLVKCNVGIGELGGAVELDPPIYHNYCPQCGAKVVER